MAVARRTAPLTLDALDRLPDPCSSCVRWELDPLAAERARREDSAAEAKRAWWRDALSEGTAGGVLARVDGDTAGYATWARPHRAGGGGAAPTAPASADAVLLMALRVEPGYRGSGLGRWLVQAVVRGSLRGGERGNGVRAVETYGRNEPTNGQPQGRGDPSGCLLPVDFLLACGFEVVREHPTTPRLRLDARRLVTWRVDVRSDVEEVWTRLRGAVGPRPAPEPAGRSVRERLPQH